MKKTILFIYGTRPELIKLYPVIKEAKRRGINTISCFTNQHDKLIKPIHECFDFVPDITLPIVNNNLIEFLSLLINEIRKVVISIKPDYILIQGDTISCLSGAICGFLDKIPVGHIEAGLRTYDLEQPFPEEANRQLVSRIASFNFAPTVSARENLINEGIKNSKIYITGNTIVDSLEYIKKKYNIVSNKKENVILITLHRRENQGSNAKKILKTIKKIALKYPNYRFILPVHENPKIKNDIIKSLSNINNIELQKPLNYIDLLKILSRAKITLTDSGGIQEEAPSFNTPVIVLRNKTERQEIIENGYGFLVGSNERKTIETFDMLIKNGIKEMQNPFGDGKASNKILDVLLEEDEY